MNTNTFKIMILNNFKESFLLVKCIYILHYTDFQDRQKSLSRLDFFQGMEMGLFFSLGTSINHEPEIITS